MSSIEICSVLVIVLSLSVGFVCDELGEVFVLLAVATPVGRDLLESCEATLVGVLKNTGAVFVAAVQRPFAAIVGAVGLGEDDFGLRVIGGLVESPVVDEVFTVSAVAHVPIIADFSRHVNQWRQHSQKSFQ